MCIEEVENKRVAGAAYGRFEKHMSLMGGLYFIFSGRQEHVGKHTMGLPFFRLEKNQGKPIEPKLPLLSIVCLPPSV